MVKSFLLEQEKGVKHYKGKFGELFCFLKELAIIHKDRTFPPERLENNIMIYKAAVS